MLESPNNLSFPVSLLIVRGIKYTIIYDASIFMDVEGIRILVPKVTGIRSLPGNKGDRVVSGTGEKS